MKNKSLFDSFNNAMQGVIHTLKNERNFKLHFITAFLVLLLTLFINVDIKEFLFVTLAITLVLVAELFNTAVEAVVDLYCGDEWTKLGKIAKDAAAGAVFITSLFAAVTGYFIIFKKLTNLNITSSTLKIIGDIPEYLTLVCIIIVIMATIVIKALTKTESYVRGGMPSSHSALAFSAATCILFLTDNTIAILMGYFLAFLVAQSRVEGKIHSILQAVLGSLLGILITALIFQIRK